MGEWKLLNYVWANPLFTLGLWLAGSSALAALAGWFRFAGEYPDRESAKLIKRFEDIEVGLGRGANLGRVHTVDVCEEGLRLSISKFAGGPFVRPFFVPWEMLRAANERATGPLSFVELSFGALAFYKMRLKPSDANAFWRVARQHWPEKGLPPEDSPLESALKKVVVFYLGGVFLALFFFFGLGWWYTGLDANFMGMAVIVFAVVWAFYCLIYWLKNK